VYNEDADLIHAGNVRRGFNQTTLNDIKNKLDLIVMRESPTTFPFAAPKNTTWVKPDLIAEIEFAEWTKGVHIKHAVFKGLRMDKQPEAVIRENPTLALSSDEKPSASDSHTKKIF